MGALKRWFYRVFARHLDRDFARWQDRQDKQ
jgi:hypothetical protein